MPFEPSLFVQGVTGLFALATLGTGAAALLFNLGLWLLIDTGTFTRAGSDDEVRAPNVRGWGARQVATGVVLWAALMLDHQVLFQVGLASVLIRQGLDLVANVLDGKLLTALLYLGVGVPTGLALWGAL